MEGTGIFWLAKQDTPLQKVEGYKAVNEAVRVKVSKICSGSKATCEVQDQQGRNEKLLMLIKLICKANPKYKEAYHGLSVRVSLTGKSCMCFMCKTSGSLGKV